MVRKVDAIILACGIIGRENKFPRALLEVNGKSLLERQIEWLSPYAKNIIICCTAREAAPIRAYLSSRAIGKKIIFSIEPEPLGTAGALKRALNAAKTDEVLVVNVDDLTDIDLRALINFGGDTICVANPRLPYGMIEMEGQIVINFREKPILSGVWVSCGVYLLSKLIANKLPERGSLEKDIFPYMKLRAYKHYGTWYTIGGHELH